MKRRYHRDLPASRPPRAAVTAPLCAAPSLELGGLDHRSVTRRRDFEMTRKTKVMAMLACAFAAAGTVAGGSIATAGTADKSSGNQLAGTWSVTVNRPAPLP